MNRKVIGIIVEWNPFHNGHVKHIQKIKDIHPNSIIVAAMSGTIVQRGEVSIVDKFLKSKVAIENNVDLVVEIPSKYTSQSADFFSYGAIKLLNHFNVTSIISGSETGDIAKIIKSSNLINSIPSEDISKKTKDGIPFSKIMYDSLPFKVGSNDILNISYYNTIQKNNFPITLSLIKRENKHDVLSSEGRISSGLNIRTKIWSGESYQEFLPNYEIKDFYRMEDFIDLIKFNIISSKIESSVINRLKKIINSNKEINYVEMVNLASSKYDSVPKIKRTIVNSLFDIDPDQEDYYRILGFSANGSNLLKNIESKKIVSNFSPLLKNELNISKILNIKYPGFKEKDITFIPIKHK